MKKLKHGVLVIFGAGFACSTLGGTITSGSFNMGVPTAASATVSGDNFTANVSNTDLGQFIFNNFPPFQAPIPGFTWFGECCFSGVLYNGLFYPVPGLFPPPSGPFAGVSFTEHLISPPPIITGPGTYNLDLFSVELSFSLFDSSGTLLHSETDTGYATGSITYTAGGPDTTYVFSRGFSATIIPEPSTWSCIALAACCLAAFAEIRLRSSSIVR